MFDRFRAASQTQQIQMIAAAMCVLGLLLGALWFVFLHTSYQPLFGDLRPTDAAAIVSALERKKIPYRLADHGTVILVPEDVVDSTRLSVMTDDIPLKGTVGFELFNKSDMGLTDFAQKINYQRALQGELERTIMTLDGVDTARVHLSLGEDRLFRDDRVPPKGSVTIRMARRAVLSESAAQGVKRLVAAAVPNLDAANVVILDEGGQVVSAALPTGLPANAVSPLAEEKRAVEEYYEARIRQAFAHANLPVQIEVAVLAEIVADGVVDNSTAGLAGWTPGLRGFPLQVTLSPAAAMDDAAQANARTLAAGAIASSLAQDDVVVFGAAVAPPPLDAVPPVTPRGAAAPSPVLAALPDEEHELSFEWGIALAAVAVFLGLGLVLLRRLRGPRRMSEKRRSDFVAKLRGVLGEGEAHATPQS